MKQFVKGAAVTVVVLIVLIAINVVGNLNGINLDGISNSAVMALCAILIYKGLTENKK